MQHVVTPLSGFIPTRLVVQVCFEELQKFLGLWQAGQVIVFLKVRQATDSTPDLAPCLQKVLNDIAGYVSRSSSHKDWLGIVGPHLHAQLMIVQ